MVPTASALMKKTVTTRVDEQPANSAKPRPMRADAQRKMSSLLAAAMEVFGTSGVDAPVREIAEKARVGLGTVYRHSAAVGSHQSGVSEPGRCLCRGGKGTGRSVRAGFRISSRTIRTGSLRSVSWESTTATSNRSRHASWIRYVAKFTSEPFSSVFQISTCVGPLTDGFTSSLIFGAVKKFPS